MTGILTSPERLGTKASSFWDGHPAATSHSTIHTSCKRVKAQQFLTKTPIPRYDQKVSAQQFHVPKASTSVHTSFSTFIKDRKGMDIKPRFRNRPFARHIQAQTYRHSNCMLLKGTSSLLRFQDFLLRPHSFARSTIRSPEIRCVSLSLFETRFPVSAWMCLQQKCCAKTFAPAMCLSLGKLGLCASLCTWMPALRHMSASWLVAGDACVEVKFGICLR